MLMVSGARIEDVADAFDGREIEGITFHLVKREGLILYMDHDGADEDTAAAVLKKGAKALPRMKNMFLNIRIADKAGNIR